MEDLNNTDFEDQYEMLPGKPNNASENLEGTLSTNDSDAENIDIPKESDSDSENREASEIEISSCSDSQDEPVGKKRKNLQNIHSKFTCIYLSLINK